MKIEEFDKYYIMEISKEYWEDKNRMLKGLSSSGKVSTMDYRIKDNLELELGSFYYKNVHKDIFKIDIYKRDITKTEHNGIGDRVDVIYGADAFGQVIKKYELERNITVNKLKNIEKNIDKDKEGVGMLKKIFKNKKSNRDNYLEKFKAKGIEVGEYIKVIEGNPLTNSKVIYGKFLDVDKNGYLYIDSLNKKYVSMEWERVNKSNYNEYIEFENKVNKNLLSNKVNEIYKEIGNLIDNGFEDKRLIKAFNEISNIVNEERIKGVSNPTKSRSIEKEVEIEMVK